MWQNKENDQIEPPKKKWTEQQKNICVECCIFICKSLNGEFDWSAFCGLCLTVSVTQCVTVRQSHASCNDSNRLKCLPSFVVCTSLICYKFRRSALWSIRFSYLSSVRFISHFHLLFRSFDALCISRNSSSKYRFRFHNTKGYAI